MNCFEAGTFEILFGVLFAQTGTATVGRTDGGGYVRDVAGPATGCRLVVVVGEIRSEVDAASRYGVGIVVGLGDVLVRIGDRRQAQAELAQIRRGFFQIAETRGFCFVMVVAYDEERDEGNAREEDVQNHDEDVELQIELKRKEEAGGFRNGIGFGTSQDGGDADARAQRRQTEQMIDEMSGGQVLFDVLVFPVKFYREDADKRESSQRGGLERMQGIEKPHAHTAIVEIRNPPVRRPQNRVNQNGQITQHTLNQYSHDGNIVRRPFLPVLMENNHRPQQKNDDNRN